MTLLFFTQAVFAQKRVKLKQADVAKGGRENGERYERLLGNVVFVQNKTTIYCDSAHFRKKQNSLEAYGNVRITEGDSVTITGRRLHYDGDKKLAQLRNNVVFTKLGTATLYTDNLDYSRPSNLAYYFSGGKLIDSVNTLTSTRGYYNVNSNLATFKNNVTVVNPDYTMYSDSLRYNSRTKIIYFITKTKVVNKDTSTFIYEKGIYNTATKISDVKEGVGESQEYTIVGDDYDLDAARNIAKVRGNVVMTHKQENLRIYGHASDYFKNNGITKVYNRPYVAKVTDDSDTLFLAADTLVSIDNKDPKKRRLLAYHNVRIYKKDMQGLADSLEYRLADSTLFLYNNPILWSQGNQMTADSINMLIQNNTISKVFLKANAFIISQDTVLNFNQVKGRKMRADFAKGKLNRMYVEGNAESLYFLLDDKTKAMMGMNKIICSSITIRFKDGKVNNLSFYTKPEGNFVPPHELEDEDKKLKGFEWRTEKKPTRLDVVRSSEPTESKNSDNVPAKIEIKKGLK